MAIKSTAAPFCLGSGRGWQHSNFLLFSAVGCGKTHQRISTKQEMGKEKCGRRTGSPESAENQSIISVVSTFAEVRDERNQSGRLEFRVGTAAAVAPPPPSSADIETNGAILAGSHFAAD